MRFVAILTEGIAVLFSLTSEVFMAAMKPRTGDGPLEVTEDGSRTDEGREVVLRLPAIGGGRLVIEMSKQEARDLATAIRQLYPE